MGKCVLLACVDEGAGEQTQDSCLRVRKWHGLELPEGQEVSKITKY